MRRRPRGRRRSVDRGTCRPGIEPRNQGNRGAQAVEYVEGNTTSSAIASCWWAPRGLRPCCMYGTSMRENREVPCPPTPLTESGPPREDQGRTPRMHGHGKSDLLVVPAKLSNNGQGRRKWWREGGDARGAWAKPHAPDSVPEQAGNRRGPRHARQTLGRKRCWSRLAERSPVRRLTRARSPLR